MSSVDNRQIPLIEADEGFCPLQEKSCSAVHRDEAEVGKVFFAYPSTPYALDVMPRVIQQMAESAEVPVDGLDWRDLDIEGNQIFCEICWTIRNSRCLIADITGLNLNVMFEYGFAIACDVPVFPLLLNTEPETSTYKRFHTMTTIGYAGYRNSKQILDKFKKKKNKPWDRRLNIGPIPNIRNQSSDSAFRLLYLMSDSSSEASLRVTEEIQSSGLDLIIDDPDEFETRSLPWYVKSIEQSSAVIAHVDDLAGKGDLQKAKAAIVMGMAVASGRRVLVVSDTADTRPIDYHDLVRTYSSASDAAQVTGDFINKVRSIVRERLTGGSTGQLVRRHPVTLTPDRTKILSRIDLGDPDAVNEEADLPYYFVETPQYRSALNPGFNLIVGRKGSGKSAIASMVSTKMQSERDQLVVRIYPRRFELNEMADSLSTDDQTASPYYIETLWKYLLLTEILRVLKQRAGDVPEFREPVGAEAKLHEVIDGYQQYLDLPFSSRLIALLDSSDFIRNESLRDRPLSEQLQATQLARLLRAISSYLCDNSLSLSVLIDGLEGNWALTDDRAGLTRILLALIRAGQDLRRSLRSEIERNAGSISVVLNLFMRTDVLDAALTLADEPDKVLYDAITWDDLDDLLEVVAQRILASAFSDNVEQFDWNTILDDEFQYERMKRFLARYMIPRPRDAVYYFDKAIAQALSRHRFVLTRDDFIRAQREYSEYAVRALSREWHPLVDDVEQVLLAFVSAPKRIKLGETRSRLQDIGIDSKDTSDVISFLIDSHFLGLAIDSNNYRYVSNPQQAKVIRAQYTRAKRETPSLIDFEVHPAFHENLGIKSSK